MWETWVWSLGWGDPWEKGKATHSSILAWRIPQTIQSMGSQRVGHHWATFTFPGGLDSKESACSEGDPGSIPGFGKSPGEGNAIYSSILAWRILWTEEPSGLQYTGSQPVRRDWVTNTFPLFLITKGEWFVLFKPPQTTTTQGSLPF